MDKNQATGLLLISAMLLIYLFFFSPKPEEAPQNATKPAATAPAKVRPDSLAAAPAAPDSATLTRQLGTFAAAAQGTARQVQLKNDDLTLTFDSKGGRIAAVRLNKYKTFFGRPLNLLDEQSARLDLRFRTTDGRTVRFSDLYFQPSAVRPIAANGVAGQELTFTAGVGGGSITQAYTLLDGSYEVGYAVRMQGLSGAVAPEPLTLSFLDHVRQTEQDAKQNRNHSTINHYLAKDDQGALAEASEKPEEQTLTEPVKWVAHKHDFFVAGIIAERPFASAKLNADVDLQDSTYLKTLSSQLAIPLADVQQGRADFRFYFGPNTFSILKQVAPEFDRNVYLGWGLFRWVNRFVVIPIFHFFEQFISSYGIIIVLLVLVIKLVTWPLTYKSYVSQARMKVLKPEIDEIKEKHGDDQAKVQSETMKLYSSMGVSPLSGCVPTLLTMPLLFAMYQFFPNAIELRQEHFLWAQDLSSYDNLIQLPFELPFLGHHISLFTVLMTLSTLLMTWQGQQMNTAMQGPMKFYAYLMPVIFFFVLNSFAAGLTWYYFVSNIITFGQQAITRNFIDDTKIRAQLEANKVKNKDKKPGGFQARLAEAMKATQEREAAAKRQTSKGK